MELLSGKMRLDRAGGNPWLLACSSLYLINIIKTQILISQDQSAPTEYEQRRGEGGGVEEVAAWCLCELVV